RRTTTRPVTTPAAHQASRPSSVSLSRARSSPAKGYKEVHRASMRTIALILGRLSLIVVLGTANTPLVSWHRSAVSVVFGGGAARRLRAFGDEDVRGQRFLLERRRGERQDDSAGHRQRQAQKHASPECPHERLAGAGFGYLQRRCVLDL